MMMTTARAAYMDASVATADPSTLLVMLCDRLVLDVQRALGAQVAGNHEEAHHQLVHAQAIVTELRLALDVDAWDGAPGLAELYRFVEQELVAANIGKDAAKVASCRTVVEPLRDAWHEAALLAP